MKVAVISGGRSSPSTTSRSLRASRSRRASRRRDTTSCRILIERDGRWLRDGAELSLRAGGGLGAPTRRSPSCTARSARTGRSRACSSASTSPTPGRACSPRRWRWTSSSSSACWRSTACRRSRSVEVGEHGWREQVAAMGTPLWVKPSRLGSSVGISKVSLGGARAGRGRRAGAKHDPRVIVEAHADGREVECSVIGQRRARDLIPGRDLTTEADWYDYEAKYSPGRDGVGRARPDRRRGDRPA